MHCLVTGVACSIGMHIAEQLLKEGHTVIGIDCYINSYSLEIKKDRIAHLMPYDRFHFIQDNLIDMDLKSLCNTSEWIFHEAGQPGVRPSWGDKFDLYTACNITATQRLLEAAINTSVRRIVYASSSSIYGNVQSLPILETTIPQPVSTYGVTKLAAEHLCHLYWTNFQVPTLSLRYFTVFGPRPRPDMAISIFANAIFSNEEIQVLGDGEQSRGFTFVSDVVNANLKAAESPYVDEVMNISGGGRISINELIRKLENIIGKKARVRYETFAKGDVMHTQADISKAEKLIGYKPEKDFDEGLAETVASIKAYYQY
ncbi:MAG TPA: UDP-glucose 4-epimerase [Candidatus Latescibacteria bacterium]|nr:UDP-glucose 4-epimerase [Candidatus Latescibacterota bacterium]